MQTTGPAPRVSDSADLGWGPDLAFLTSSQVMVSLVTRGPH